MFADLRAAFARESMAAQRYRYFAQIAEIEGYVDIARQFTELAESVGCVAHGHLDLLRSLADPGSGQPMGDTQLNVASAVSGGQQDVTELYPALLAAAHAEGLAEVAGWLRTVEALKKAHLARLEETLASLVEEPFAVHGPSTEGER